MFTMSDICRLYLPANYFGHLRIRLADQATLNFDPLMLRYFTLAAMLCEQNLDFLYYFVLESRRYTQIDSKQ